jgi:integrase
MTTTDIDKYLRLRGKNKDIYYFQMRTPKGLQFLVKKKMVLQSLETSDIKVARRKRDEILSQMKHLEETAIGDEFNFFHDKYANLSKEELYWAREKLSDELRDKYPWAGHREQGNLPDPTKEEMAEIDAMSVLLGGKKPDNYKLTLKQAMRKCWEYKSEPGYSHKTKMSHAKSVEKFELFMDKQDIQVDTIRRRNARDFKKYLEDMKDESGKRLVSNATIQRHFSDLSVFWRFARDDEEFDVQNPFEKHGISKTTGQKSYLPWHPDDLREIINLMSHPFDRLVIYIAWYTGSRLGECLSIRPEDIYEGTDDVTKEKIWVVAIKPDDEERKYFSDEDKSAKNENARRIVPIHDDLLEPLKEFKQSNEGWRLPNSNQYSKYFGRLKKKIKNPHNTLSRQYSFHSIRSNTATNFERARVPEGIAARVIGHSTTGVTMSFGLYSDGVTYTQALEEINKLPTL